MCAYCSGRILHRLLRQAQCGRHPIRDLRPLSPTPSTAFSRAPPRRAPNVRILRHAIRPAHRANPFVALNNMFTHKWLGIAAQPPFFHTKAEQKVLTPHWDFQLAPTAETTAIRASGERFFVSPSARHGTFSAHKNRTLGKCSSSSNSFEWPLLYSGHLWATILFWFLSRQRWPALQNCPNIHQLTNGGENAEAYWSPDGKRLIFQSTRGDLKCDQIFIMNADGSDQHMVSTGKGRTTCGYFLPDNKHIVYASTHLGGDACPPAADRSKGYVGPSKQLRHLRSQG